VTWLGVIQSLLGIIGTVMGYLRERKLIDGAIAEAVNLHLSRAIDEITKANAARDRIRSDAVRHPERLHDDDGFRRD